MELQELNTERRRTRSRDHPLNKYEIAAVIARSVKIPKPAISQIILFEVRFGVAADNVAGRCGMLDDGAGIFSAASGLMIARLSCGKTLPASSQSRHPSRQTSVSVLMSPFGQPAAKDFRGRGTELPARWRADVPDDLGGIGQGVGSLARSAGENS